MKFLRFFLSYFFVWCSFVIDISHGNQILQASRLIRRLKHNKQEFKHVLNDLHLTGNRYMKIFETIEKRNLKGKLGNFHGTYDQEKCQKQLELLLEAVGNGDQWAMEMMDATGRPGPGVFEGNVKWYGSYDECLKVNARVYDQNIQGQYCTLFIPLNMSGNPLTGETELFVLSGFCAPNTCTEPEVVSFMNSVMKMLPIEGMNITVRKTVCQTGEVEFDTAAYVAMSILGLLFLLIVFGTGYDAIYIQWPLQRRALDLHQSFAVTAKEKEPLVKKEIKSHPAELGKKDKFFQAFSLYTNGKKILDTSKTTGELSAIYGIRYLSISWVVLGHNFLFGLDYISNLVKIDEYIHKRSMQVIVNGMLSVDTFFAVSGFLSGYLVLKELEKKDGRMNWVAFYIHRFWRITPPYMLVLMVFSTLYRYFGYGPVWHTIDYEVKKCKEHWWMNLLYINNFQEPMDMCMNWSWYLANEIQFFIISPLMLIPLSRCKSFAGAIPSLVLLLGTTATAGILSKAKGMPPSMFSNVWDEDRILQYVKWYYFFPCCRIGPYIVGILAGYLLWRIKGKFKMNIYVNLGAWCVSTTLACSILYGTYDSINDETFSADVSALYNAIHRSIWGACICWVIFACATGNGGPVNVLLSWKFFIPLSRLSYCIYLVHPITIGLFLNTLQMSLRATDFLVIYLFIAQLAVATMVAFLASLVIEAPMMGLEKLIFSRRE